MKTLEQATKKELIEYIKEIRPYHDCYHRVCKSLGITDNILTYVDGLKRKIELLEEENKRLNEFKKRMRGVRIITN